MAGYSQARTTLRTQRPDLQLTLTGPLPLRVSIDSVQITTERTGLEDDDDPLYTIQRSSTRRPPHRHSPPLNPLRPTRPSRMRIRDRCSPPVPRMPHPSLGHGSRGL